MTNTSVGTSFVTGEIARTVWRVRANFGTFSSPNYDSRYFNAHETAVRWMKHHDPLCIDGSFPEEEEVAVNEHGQAFVQIGGGWKQVCVLDFVRGVWKESVLPKR